MMQILEKLTDKEKVELAARLTQAALSHCEYGQPRTLTPQNVAKASADRAYTVFGYLLEHIIQGKVPQRFPDE